MNGEREAGFDPTWDGVGRRDEVPCRACKRLRTPEGHDPCLGTLPDPDVMNACCGHGDADEAYVQFWSAPRIAGDDAIAYFAANGCGPTR